MTILPTRPDIRTAALLSVLLLLVPAHTMANDPDPIRARASEFDGMTEVPPSPEIRMSTGRTHFFRALDDKGELPKSREAFEPLVAHPQYGPAAQMYLATLQCLEGRYAFWPLERWNLAQRGLAAMDEIAGRHPNNVEVRFLRASTGYHLPRFFGRADQARADIQLLVQRFPERYSSLPPDLRKVIGHFLLDVHPHDPKVTELVRGVMKKG